MSSRNKSISINEKIVFSEAKSKSSIINIKSDFKLKFELVKMDFKVEPKNLSNSSRFVNEVDVKINFEIIKEGQFNKKITFCF